MDTGNAGLRRVGNILLIAGTAVLFAGGTAALAANSADVRYASLVVGGVGLLGLFASIPFLVFSQTTLRFD